MRPAAEKQSLEPDKNFLNKAGDLGDSATSLIHRNNLRENLYYGTIFLFLAVLTPLP
jgi:hypothetical protein